MQDSVLSETRSEALLKTMAKGLQMVVTDPDRPAAVCKLCPLNTRHTNSNRSKQRKARGAHEKIPMGMAANAPPATRSSVGTSGSTSAPDAMQVAIQQLSPEVTNLKLAAAASTQYNPF